MWGELKTAGRGLIRAPSFAVVALTTLALGIGANTALFSVADVLLFTPLPYPEPDELVSVWLDASERGGSSRSPLTRVDLDAIDSESALFQSVSGWVEWTPTLSTRVGPSVLSAASVTEDMFGRVLGVQPVLGRSFRAEEFGPDGARTVIIGDAFWTEHFARDPAVLGRSVPLDDVPYTVVGVMGPTFRAPFAPAARLWRPLVDGDAPDALGVIGRLAPGLTASTARERVDVVARRAAESWPDALVDVRLELADLRSDLLGPAPLGLRLLLVAFGLLLLVSCGNATALVMLRGLGRDAEWRVRRALGAHSWAVLRIHAAEALLLGLGGSVVGIALAAWSTDLVFTMAPIDRRFFASPGLGPRVLAFAAGIGVVASLLVGLFASATSRRSGAVGEVRAGRGDGLRVAFIGMQLACAAALLTSAAVLWRSLDALDRVDLGFEAEGRYVVRYDMPVSARSAADDAVRGHLRTALDRLGRVPGVVAVGAASEGPMTPARRRVAIRAGDLVEGTRQGTLAAVTPGYFYTVGQRVLDGRDVDAADDPASPAVVVVSEAVARTSFDWPRTSPVGRRLHVGVGTEGAWRDIVGVVTDVRPDGPRASPAMAVYVPDAQSALPTGTLVAHVDGSPGEVVSEIRRMLAGRDDPIAPAAVGSLRASYVEATRPERFAMRLFLVLAGVTLALAAVGVYGIVGQRVGSRMRELGIRRAVGATAEDLRVLVTRRASRLTVLGLVVGAAAGVGFTDFLDALLFGVPRLDPLSIAAASTALLATALTAAWLPARRAARVDTIRVLRDE